ncbi:MAG: DUF5667 domain-containing protein [bacterium]|nr:DUF5667 domain-containing protein [bacterium]
MRFLSRVGFISAASALALSSFVPHAFANHVSEVLGETTGVTEIKFPGLAAGPGFILPDSSLYSLDQLVQELRLVLAFVPEQQAVVQKNILGERLAEARVELSRGNLQATELALSGAEKAARGLADSIADAASKGRGSAELARTMNQTLQEYRSALTSASNQAPTSLAYRLDATSQVLLEAKVRVEDELPGDELASAIENDLLDVIDKQVLGVQSASSSLLKKYNFLENRSSLSTDQRMKYEEMLASKSGVRKELLEQRKKALQDYQEQKKKLQEERKKIYDQIKLLMVQLQANQKAIQQLQRIQNSLNNGGAIPSITPTVTPSPEE